MHSSFTPLPALLLLPFFFSPVWLVFSSLFVILLLFWFVVVTVKSLSCLQLFVTPQTVAHQVPLSSTTSQSLFRLLSIESMMPSNYLILCSLLLLLPSIFPHIKVFFPVSWLFTSGGQNIGASASATVLPMNIQGWFPLGWTDLISLQSRGLSRVFSNTTVQKHQFFGTQLSL